MFSSRLPMSRCVTNLTAILAGDELLSLGMLGEHVVVQPPLAQKVLPAELTHKLLAL